MQLKVGYCGLDCEACPVFIARATNDDELRVKTAKEWSELYAEYLGKDSLKPADMNCNGCHSENAVFIGCRSCPIRKCCQEKGIGNCANCNEYKSCEMIKGFFSVPSHEKAKVNLDRIRITLDKPPKQK